MAVLLGKIYSGSGQSELRTQDQVCLSKVISRPKVLVDIEGLPFSENGHKRAKSMLEKECGKTKKIVDA